VASSSSSSSSAQSVPYAEAVAALPKAIQKTLWSDTAAISLKDLALKANLDFTGVAVTNPNGASTSSSATSAQESIHSKVIAKANVDLSEGQAALAVKGLTASDPKDFGLSLTAGAKVGFDAALSVDGQDVIAPTSFSKQTMAAGYYIHNGNVYFDYSNANLHALVDTITTLSSSATGSSSGATSFPAGKYLLGEGLSSLPSLAVSDENWAKVVSGISTYAPYLADYAQTSYADGIYTVALNLKIEDIEEVVARVVPTISTDYSYETILGIAQVVGNFFTVNKAALSVSFSPEQGLLSVVPDIDISFASTFGILAKLLGDKTEYTSEEQDYPVSASLQLSGKLSADYSNVSVVVPSDLDSYVSLSPKVQ
jgi:methionine-rich copper-binding protein CopC